MADPPKKPETTRPLHAISGGKDPKETTRPVPPADGSPAPQGPPGARQTGATQALGKTQPTRVISGGARPITGATAPYRSPQDAARKTGSQEARRTGSHEARRTGAQEARRTGSHEVRRTGSQEARRTGSMRRPGEIFAEPLVTEGMKARRREIERKKRRALIERLRTEAELSEGWQRIWKTVGLVFLVLASTYGYWRIQHLYGNQWPILAVWIMLSVVIVTAFAWLLWYMNRGDA